MRQYLVMLRTCGADIPVMLLEDLTAATRVAESLDVDRVIQRIANGMRFAVDPTPCNVSIVNFVDGVPVDWDVIRELDEEEDPRPGPVGEAAVEVNAMPTVEGLRAD